MDEDRTRQLLATGALSREQLEELLKQAREARRWHLVDDIEDQLDERFPNPPPRKTDRDTAIATAAVDEILWKPKDGG